MIGASSVSASGTYRLTRSRTAEMIWSRISGPDMETKSAPTNCPAVPDGGEGGNEVKKAVQSEDEKDQAEKETGDDSGCFHVKIV